MKTKGQDQEFIDEIDSRGNTIAKHPKSYLKERIFMHRACLIIPISKDHEVLLTRRAKDKYLYPDTWCCFVGGKVRSGEKEEQAAMREMKEEIGKTYPLKKVATFVYDQEDYKALFSIFTISVTMISEELKFDPREIQYSKKFGLNKLLNMVEQRPDDFNPTFIAAIKEFAKYYKR